MKSLSQFLNEPLANMMWLAIASVTILVGLRGIDGPVGIGVAILAVVPLLLMLAGAGPLTRVMTRIFAPRPAA